MVDEKLLLTGIAFEQLQASMKLKKERMNVIKDIEDLYNNKVLELDDNRINVKFPIMSGQIDTIFSKIDNPPSVDFIIKKAPQLAAKIRSAWKQDSSSMKAGWSRKDRAEKKLALISGRGIYKIYASSVNNEYKAHYDLVDYHNFHCEGTRGHLDDNLYCGESEIYRTRSSLLALAKKGVYYKDAVESLISKASSGEYKNYTQEVADGLNRMKALNLNPENNAYVGQDVYSLVEWNVTHKGQLYYILFEPSTLTCLRMGKQKDIFGFERKLWGSWAVNYDEYNFWSKGAGDDIMPMAEAMRILLNEALNNQQRRNRPMRIVDGNSFQDVNELMDYIPDNVIISNPNKNKDIITIETPEITTTVNLVQFLNNFMSEKTGVTGQGVDEKDAAVGVYYGNIQQEADRIGIINKAYSDSYAEKAYAYFWGLKKNITEAKMVEMLGKDGYHWEELTKEDFVGCDDVDDIITTGGSREEQISEIRAKRQSEVLAQLTGNPTFSAKLNPVWVIETSLKAVGFNEDDIQIALDVQGDVNRELVQEADQAIALIMEGKSAPINRGASTVFIQRLLDYDLDNLDFYKMDKDGNVTGVDNKVLEMSNKIRAYAEKHVPIAIQNMQRDVRQKIAQAGQMEKPSSQIKIPTPTEEEAQIESARPFEVSAGTTSAGTAATSQNISSELNPTAV